MDSDKLQIIESNSDNSITLNEDLLREVLTSDAVKDKYISVVSIAGTFRQGKSFLLNFFLRYLQKEYFKKADITDWLKPEDGPLEGFSWTPGCKRHTTGIVMWREVFFVKVPTGEEVAVILLDTQGTFDNQTSIDDCARIFALSTLISSVQIYNVMRSIKQYDLSHLQCFGGYGSLMTDFGEKPFQNFWFLVRDWPNPHEYQYGSTGGENMLKEEVFQTTQDEVKELIQDVTELFENINCFLMPYPGRAVDGNNTYNGTLNDIEQDFKQQVQNFVRLLLSPEKLILKRIAGAYVTGKELMYYIQEYSKILKNGDLPKVEIIFKANAEAQHRSAHDEALKLYQKNMEADVMNNTTFDPEIEDKHNTHKEKSIEYYSILKKFADEEIFQKYLSILEEDLESEFQRYKAFNDKKLECRELKKKIGTEYISGAIAGGLAVAWAILKYFPR